MNHKLQFDLALTEAGYAHHIVAIKALRMASGWGLKEAKDVVDVLRDRYRSGIGGTSRRVVMFASQAAFLHWCGDGCFEVTNVERHTEPEVLDLTAGGPFGPTLKVA